MRKFLKQISLVVLLAFSTTLLAQTAVTYSVNNLFNKAQTYRAAISGFTAAATPTDVFVITGSATKTVYIKSISISGVKTADGTVPVQLAKRSTANTNGTAVALTEHPLDSTNGTATAVATYYTANATVGTGVTIGAKLLALPSAAGSTIGSTVATTWTFGDFVNQFVVLRGVAQSLAINLAGATVTGAVLNAEVEWMEQ